MIKLLAVDDEELIQVSLCKFFRNRGYETYGASTGEEALDLIKKVRPHLVLLDVMLDPSGMDGFDVLEKIKQIDKTIKVIIITGRATDKASIEKATQLGANDFLTKPLDYEKLEKEAIPK
ncbi:MAG: response regulator, partial [Pseudomonadota bacterium]